MTEITIRVAPDVNRRLRARAQQAGTNVPLLVGDLVATSAALLTDPELSTPPRALLRKVAELHEHEATPAMIAQQLDLPDATVSACLVELDRLARIADRYTR
ncbi:hypothetical protein [Amnibacterium setariae]|uniref:Uncharacterized protein n=1 Tax=Amnibacterium setariae TaxID=2306585 RepID=A0A3A1TSY6_9MICO|nr:hypothetical protein [Amnibacterium setariae]RIX26473.1 hypothetical protein D1781_16185 [Amnibacterium setariae]